jgi:hypothetical protein
MTRADAIRLLEVLSAAYPTYPLEKATVELYISALAGVDASVASPACARWVQEQDRFPTISQVIGACRAIVGEYQSLPALPAPQRVDPDEFRRGLERARASLKRPEPSHD